MPKKGERMPLWHRQKISKTHRGREDPPGMKYCVQCKQVKPLESFPCVRSKVDGRHTYCRACLSERNATRTTMQRRAEYIKRLYGITLEEYMVMFWRQRGLCALCGEPETKRRYGNVMWLAIDHDHRTGRVRALLCMRCNRMLGYLGESLDLLDLARDYIVNYVSSAGECG